MVSIDSTGIISGCEELEKYFPSDNIECVETCNSECSNCTGPDGNNIGC